VHLATGVGENVDKATLDRRAWSGATACNQGPVGDVLGDVSEIAYSWHVANDGGFSYAAPAVKLLVDTADTNGTSTTHFETIADKILVYEPYLQSGAMMAEDVWIDETITATQGLFWLVDLTPGGSTTLGGISRSDLRTLSSWDAAMGGTGEIVALQLGVGSYNQGVSSWVDSLRYTSTWGDVLTEFTDPSGSCDATSTASAKRVLRATGDFMDRGIAVTSLDASIRLEAAEVAGADETTKNAALSELADALDDAAKHVGRGNSRPVLRRLRELRQAADGDGDEDILFGGAAVAFNRMLDRAEVGLQQGRGNPHRFGSQSR
jgi:hypothetical protein